MAQAMEIDAPKKEDLFKAAESGNASFFRSLSEDELRHALSLTNEDGRSILHVAASAGRTEVVSFLAAVSPASGIVNSTDEDGWAPLHSAASCGNGEIVNILLENGADVNLTNNGGRTALHYAASKGWLKIAETLISHGAKINKKDKVGCTPLHRAASTGHLELCELLIEEGAEIDAVDRAGQTALMQAVICCNKERSHEEALRKQIKGFCETLFNYSCRARPRHSSARSYLLRLHDSFLTKHETMAGVEGQRTNIGEGDGGEASGPLGKRRRLLRSTFCVWRDGAVLCSEEAVRLVWEGAIPLLIHLHEFEVTALPPPPPVLVALLLIRHGADIDIEDKEGYTVLGRATGELRKSLLDAAKAMLEG